MTQDLFKLKLELLKPDIKNHHNHGSDKYFDPWILFPAIYGAYDSDFGDVAISVLQDLVSGKFNAQSNAQCILKEMLCVDGLCEYGTSPRCCWAEPEFKEILPDWIERFNKFQLVYWSDDL